MSSCNSLVMAFARHGRRGAVASTTTSNMSTTTARGVRRQPPPHPRRWQQRQQQRRTVLRSIASSSSSSGDGSRDGPGHLPSSLASLVAVASAAAAFAAAASASAVPSTRMGSTMSPACRCESHPANGILEMAGEEDDDDDGGVPIRDGMDAGAHAAPSPSPSSSSSGPADAEEDENEKDDDDDGGEDEETTCSICLINRQGPCRSYWLKFERCMKDHGKEKERKGKGKSRGGSDVKAGEGGANASHTAGGGDGVDARDDVGDDDEWPSPAAMEAEWDAFMEKSTRPGEDDDDEDDGGGEDDDDDDEEKEEDVEEDEGGEGKDHSSSSSKEAVVAVEDSNGRDDDEDDDDNDNSSSLAERCDRFMIPWIGCIQEHRNAYTLISNAFYRDDYVDPLESTIPDHRRHPFPIMERKEFEVEEIDDVVRGYVVKFHGVEIDLGNWKEHAEADDDDDDGDEDGGNGDDGGKVATAAASSASSPGEEPHLINAHARFHLSDADGRRPIEVAYIKDQNGTLLGFDSFTKAKQRGGEGDVVGGEDSHYEGDREASSSPTTPKDGECTFHIIPGETTSIVAYAVYRGTARGEDGVGSAGGAREDVLYYTHEIPLPQSGART